MHRKTAALLASIVLLSATTAMAQDRGSQADQDACTPDVFRLCQEDIPNEGPILACLQAKHSQLSAACEPVIFPHTAAAATEDADVAKPAPKRHGKHKRKRKHPGT